MERKQDAAAIDASNLHCKPPAAATIVWYYLQYYRTVPHRTRHLDCRQVMPTARL